VILHPDEEVQARILFVFQQFREIRTACGVMRYLRQVGLPLPVRPLRGPAPHEVVWQEARASSVRDILQTQPMPEPMSMDARSSIQRNVGLTLQGAGMSGSLVSRAHAPEAHHPG
jgi:hypothetical protein